MANLKYIFIIGLSICCIFFLVKINNLQNDLNSKNSYISELERSNSAYNELVTKQNLMIQKYSQDAEYFQSKLDDIRTSIETSEYSMENINKNSTVTSDEAIQWLKQQSVKF